MVKIQKGCWASPEMKIRTVKKAVIAGCLCLAIGLWFGFFATFFYFHDGHLPRNPQPESGRVYSSNNHGSVVYLNKQEDNLLLFLQLGAGVSFVIGYFLNHRWRVFTDPLAGLSQKQRYKILHGRKDE